MVRSSEGEEALSVDLITGVWESLKAVRERAPLVDPVGAGATRYRTATAAELARQAPAVIRGNASEVLAVAGEAGATRGVDVCPGRARARRGTGRNVNFAVSSP